jgi:Ig-like domain from next to BRCA1 gene
MKILSFGITLTLFSALVGCNLPGGQVTPSSPDAVYTQAAETVAAELTRVALLASPTPNIPTNTLIPTSTSTLAPTNTPVFTSTNTPIPCNLGSFVTDVTYPDNTIVAPNQVIVKTWRIKNNGSCSWNSSYLLIFDHQDGMGVNSGYTQPLTIGIVNPGQDVDLTVNLTAPATPGTYTGYWRMRDPGGVLFGITPAGGTFLVKIKVVASNSITLVPVTGESGTICSDTGLFPDYTAGESNADITQACQMFLSFDISSIPVKTTITEVKINFKDYTITGNPFGSLGVLNGYLTNYGSTLESADFVTGFPSGNTVDWGSVSPLNTIEVSPELKAALQSKVGSSRFQMRMQFAGSNGDAIKDRITFNNPSLIVTYSTP